MNNHNTLLKNEYDLIWQKFIEDINYKDIIENHKIDRKVYHDIVLKYSRNFKSPKVMEIGSGSGIDINLLKEKNMCIKAYASDISLNSIKVSQKIAEGSKNRIEHFVADTLKLAIKDCQLDIIFSQGLIEHFINPIDPIREQLRVLKEGGFLIINVPQKFTGYTFMKKRKMRNGKWHLGWETEFSYGELKRIQSLFKIHQREVFGYQYWRSWLEPAFVLRDFYDKFQRKNPLKNYFFFQLLKKSYDHIWNRIERAYGHYFLKNIVVVLQKEMHEDTSR